MLTSIVLGLVFITQPIVEHTAFSSEFSQGKELVYQLSKRDGGTSINPDSIGDNVSIRLDRAGIKNAHVEVVGSGDSAELRVSFVPKSAVELNEVNRQINATGELSICTSKDYCLTGKEFFDVSNPVSLRYVGGSAYPGFNIKSKIAVSTFLEQLGGEENATAYIWQNYDPDNGIDNYENAFGEKPKDEVKEKVIASIVWQGNYIEEDLRLYATNDIEGNAFTLFTARSFVNAYNNEDYGCNVKYLYTTKIEPTYSSSSLTMIIIALLSIVALIGVGLAVYNRGAGAINFLSVLVIFAAQLLINAYLGFEFAPASIVAIVITLTLAVFNLINTNQKIKEEIKKGRTISKAVVEGNRKSFWAILDSSAVTFIVSLFAFLLGKGMIKTFGGTLLVGSLLTFFVLIIINRWLMFFTANSPLGAIGKGTLGLRVRDKEAPTSKKLVKPLTVDSAKKKRKIGLITYGAIALCSTAILLGTGLTNGVFRNSDEYTSSARLDIMTQSENEVYEDSESCRNFLLDKMKVDEVELSYLDFDYQRVDKKDEYDNDYAITYVSFKLDSEYLKDKKLDTAVNNLRTDLDYEMKTEDKDKDVKVTLGEAKVVNIEHNTSNMFLILGLSLLFSSLYLFARFGISLFLSYLVSGVIGLTGIVAIFSLLMLPFNSTVAFGFLAVVQIMSFILVSIFTKNREILKDRKIVKKASVEERAEIMDSSIRSSLPSVLSASMSVLVSSVLLIAFSASETLLSSILIFAVGSLLIAGLFFAFVPSFYLFFRTHIKFKEINFKRFKRKKKPVQINTNEPHETIIMGLNDFR